MATACRTATLGLALLSLSLYSMSAVALFNRCSTRHPLPGIELPDHLSFSAVVAAPEEPGCHRHTRRAAAGNNAHELVQADEGPKFAAPAGASEAAATLKLHSKHRSTASGDRSAAEGTRKQVVVESPHHDQHRVQTLHRRIAMEKYQNAQSRLAAQHHRRRRRGRPTPLRGQLVTTLASWASLGYGEFLADVFVGTPPRQYSLVVDTGSDLSWLECLPCYDCFEQSGRYYPALSSSYWPLPCSDTRCHLVNSHDNPVQPCGSTSQPCSYFYWYGDGGASSTGNLALEAFTFGLNAASGSAAHRVENVIFGCGQWNKGFSNGATGLLGLGRGPLSFSSQLSPLYGRVFSYCLVDWHSGLSASGKLIFGEDPALMVHQALNFTSFVAGAIDTYYYVRVKGIKVAGELLDIPPETWELSPDGLGGVIIDSGVTLSRFSGPALRAIREAWAKTAKHYPAATLEDFPALSPCCNVSGVGNVSLPEFSIMFADGAVWNFPPENFFIRLGRAEEVVCLAVLGDPLAFSMILGNYQQQNFHVVYDAERSRLGFAPERCADV